MILNEFIQKLKVLTDENFNDKEKVLLDKALQLMSIVYEKIEANDKEKYLDKLYDLIIIVLKELHLSYESFIAVILYQVKKFEPLTNEFLENQYNKSISLIIEGVWKINNIKVQRITEENVSVETKKGDLKRKVLREKERVAVQTENYITLLLTLADDVRSILVKLGLVLFDMRNMNDYSEEIQVKIATETSVIYAPIAHRLGLYAIKTELEELSMKKLHNEMYHFIKEKLNENKENREKFIEDFITPIKKHFASKGLKFSIKGRPKSIYSIWNKMKKQKTTFEKIYDLFAIRIIVNEPYFEKANLIRDELSNSYTELQILKEENSDKKKQLKTFIAHKEKELDDEIKLAKQKEKKDCWNIYSEFSNWYELNTNRLRDWITNPKETGYESLHTTVAVPDTQQKWVEVQIRTQRMDEVAEKGQAAHWKYKSANNKSNTDNWAEKIRTMLENLDDNLTEKFSASKAELYQDVLFIFTPKGDLKKMKNKSTLLDFAYAIHSNIGDKCVGGEVNGKHVSIKYKLKNGDRINIKTSPNQKPTPDWLNIAHTRSAQKRIQLALNETKYKDAAAGKDMLMYKFKQLKLDFQDDTLFKICNELNLKKIVDLYQAVGEGKIEITQIKELLDKIADNEKNTNQRTHQKIQDNKYEQRGVSREEDVSHEYLLIGDSVKGLNYDLAQCCKPVPGDTIFGFVTIGKGTKIHKVSCPNAAQMMSRFPYRVVKAQWNTKNSVYDYMGDLIITGINSVGIVANITSLIKKEPLLNLHSINVDAKDGMFKGKLTLFSKNKKEFEKFSKTLKTVKGVLNVQ
jgi:GTP pyrophosphokinase